MAGKAGKNKINIKLYSTPSCSKCMLTSRLLDDRIKYESIKDTSAVIAKSRELDIMEMPILEVNGEYFVGVEAVKKAQSLVEEISA